jgi:hypothetical protein
MLESKGMLMKSLYQYREFVCMAIQILQPSSSLIVYEHIFRLQVFL